MSDADVLFSRLATEVSPQLVFGELDAPVAGVVECNILAQLPPLSCAATVRASTPVRITAQLPGMTVSAAAQYRTNTQRPTVSQRQPAWQIAAHGETGVSAAQQDTASQPSGATTALQRAHPAHASTAHGMPQRLVLSHEQLGHPHTSATPARTGAGLAQQDGTRNPQQFAARIQDTTQLRYSRVFRHQDADHSKRGWRAARGQAARPAARSSASPFQPARPFLARWCARHQAGRVPPPGRSVWAVVPPPFTCYTPSPHLLFVEAPGTPSLLFSCTRGPDAGGGDGQQVIVPVRRVYIVLNNIQLARASDGTPVPCFEFKLSFDTESWTMGFSASLRKEAEALVDLSNGPVDLIASVNGRDYRVLVEEVSRQRSYGSAVLSVSGRGRNAILAAPYAPVRNFEQTVQRTAQQLMVDALKVNGVGIGWSVDWGLTDWLVPAGVMTGQGTHMELVNRIAQAAGGYIAPHPSNAVLRVRHRWPVAPWDMATATPQIVLPVDVVTTEGMRWVEKPGYNRVFVSGQNVGVLGQVTRAGTAGDMLAPMVVDPLITDAAAARQRGIAVLADTGRQVSVSLRLPVLDATGVIEPGAFIEYQDGTTQRRGIVRATQVEAGLATVWQQLEVQTHV
ncbi:MAG: hypothetical protein ACK40S_10970 [Burkholderiaceae bacterium]